MIVCGGENVFPREVEDLLADHESIEEAAVIGVPDEQFGQRLKAFVVLRGGAELDEESVQDYVKANLARYKVPREVVFLESCRATRPARCSSANCRQPRPVSARRQSQAERSRGVASLLSDARQSS